MHPLRLYMASPLFVTYAVSCITLTFLVAHVWHACVLVVAVNWLWFVVRLWVDSLLHAVTNSVSFHHLQACHSCWASCHLPQVLCLFPWWASCISWVLARPHFGHLTLQALFHLGVRPHSTRLLRPLIPLSRWNAGSAGGQHFTSQPTGRFPWPHLAIYPCPSPPKAEGRSLLYFLGVLLLCIYCRSDTRPLHPGIVGLLQADHLGGPAPQRKELARVW